MHSKASARKKSGWRTAVPYLVVVPKLPDLLLHASTETSYSARIVDLDCSCWRDVSDRACSIITTESGRVAVTVQVAVFGL